MASECNATFFSISASSLTSRYVGEGEKLVRALFECARDHAPAIIFMDEIDSLLTSRGGDHEQESSRRMKTEFLVQFDGVQSGGAEERVLVVGATNLPWELDEAALRRFPKRILVDRPDAAQREELCRKLLFGAGDKVCVRVSDGELRQMGGRTDGYSASDLKHLVNDATMGPIRALGLDLLSEECKAKDIPPVTLEHLEAALDNIRPSTSKQAQRQFVGWNQRFGTILKMPPHKQKSKRAMHKKQDLKKSGSAPASSWFSMFQ